MNSNSISWIEADELNQIIDSSITILDVQPDIHDYIKEHIPGAVYFHENHLRAYHGNLPSHYSPSICIQNLFQQVGLNQNQTVIVYGSDGSFSGKGDGLEQPMVAYSLARFGHTKIRLLNGGLSSWIESGFSLTKTYPHVDISNFSVNLISDLFVNYNQFIEIKDNKDTVIVDVRPRSVYQGEGLWSKPGHIPGAVNLPWRLLMSHDNPRLLRSESSLRELSYARSVIPEKQIILYCGTGREATAAFIVFKYLLNYPAVKIFEGSFTEWVAHPENETVTGPQPR